jgi:hypothetical protein
MQTLPLQIRDYHKLLVVMTVSLHKRTNPQITVCVLVTASLYKGANPQVAPFSTSRAAPIRLSPYTREQTHKLLLVMTFSLYK